MKVKIAAKKLGDTFEKAHRSLWDGKDIGISVEEQIAYWRDKFHATVSGGHFDHVNLRDVDNLDNPYYLISEHEWNTEDAIVEFDNHEDFVLFILEWS